MDKKLYIVMVLILCSVLALLVFKVQIQPSGHDTSTIPVEQKIGTSSSVETIHVRGEQHVQLTGIVTAVIPKPDQNDNTVILSLKDSDSLQITLHLGHPSYRIFVRRFEENSKRYKGKVTAVEDILPILIKGKEIQIELGLPKDKSDEHVIQNIADYARIQTPQSTSIDIPNHLIVRFSIY